MSAEPNKPARPSAALRRLTALAWAFAAAAAIGFVTGFVAGLAEDGLVPAVLLQPWVIVLALALALGGAMAASLSWWRSIDELARKAHESAWLWGGSAGLLGGWMLLSFAPAWPAGAQAALSGETPERLLFLGGAVTAVGALTGYGLAWILFWLRQR